MVCGYTKHASGSPDIHAMLLDDASGYVKHALTCILQLELVHFTASTLQFVAVFSLSSSSSSSLSPFLSFLPPSLFTALSLTHTHTHSLSLPLPVSPPPQPQPQPQTYLPTPPWGYTLVEL